MPLHPAVASKELVPAPEPLTVPIIDAHTHLDACGIETADHVAAALSRAAAVGVAGAVTVGGDIDSNRWAVRAAGERALSGHRDLYAAVAIHPTEALTADMAARAELEQLAADPAVVAIGETGLDLYWDSAPIDVQREAFAWHIDLAKRVGKPLMIHDRLAHDEILDVLRAEGAPETVIFHCFSGGPELARVCAEHGYLMSFAGPVSFTNARELAEAARIAPQELIMVETDAPFLTPHPHRGRRNEPYALPYTLRALAALRGTEPEILADAVRLTTESAYKISVMN